MPQKLPAGWYKDPKSRIMLRFWDGERWTEKTQPNKNLSGTPETETRVSEKTEDTKSQDTQGHSVQETATEQAPAQPAGWYPTADPQTARWWNAAEWTNIYARKPYKPANKGSWYSIPLFVAAPVTLLHLLLLTIRAPRATIIALAISTLLAAGLALALLWLDRLEPEPKQELWHAFLWGAVLVTGVGLLVGFATTSGDGAGGHFVRAAFEEAAKAAGILFIARRGRIDSLLDGIVYAGWIGAGATLTANASYYVTNRYEVYGYYGSDGMLTAAFNEGLASVLTQSVFAVPVGMAVAAALVYGKNLAGLTAVGYVAGTTLHSLWDIQTGGSGASWTLALILSPLLAATGAMLVYARNQGKRTLAEQISVVAEKYGLTEKEKATFSDWNSMLKIRKELKIEKRNSFDELHAAIARLCAIEERKAPASAEHLRRVTESLWEARVPQ